MGMGKRGAKHLGFAFRQRQREREREIAHVSRICWSQCHVSTGALHVQCTWIKPHACQGWPFDWLCTQICVCVPVNAYTHLKHFLECLLDPLILGFIAKVERIILELETSSHVLEQRLPTSSDLLMQRVLHRSCEMWCTHILRLWLAQSVIPLLIADWICGPLLVFLDRYTCGLTTFNCSMIVPWLFDTGWKLLCCEWTKERIIKDDEVCIYVYIYICIYIYIYIYICTCSVVSSSRSST